EDTRRRRPRARAPACRLRSLWPPARPEPRGGAHGRAVRRDRDRRRAGRAGGRPLARPLPAARPPLRLPGAAERPTWAVHGYLGLDEVPPMELRRLGRRQALRAGAELEAATVQRVE